MNYLIVSPNFYGKREVPVSERAFSSGERGRRPDFLSITPIELVGAISLSRYLLD